MAARALAAAHYRLLKLKLGGDGDEERLAAVRQAVPDARLIADANEAWRASDLERLLTAAKAARVELIEQPLAAGDDALLQHIARVVPLCADESVHDRASLATIAKRYAAAGVKPTRPEG
jgi:L-alanine-DL-glutamate epimerase-like enolase superfamily enzyme